MTFNLSDTRGIRPIQVFKIEPPASLYALHGAGGGGIPNLNLLRLTFHQLPYLAMQSVKSWDTPLGLLHELKSGSYHR